MLTRQLLISPDYRPVHRKLGLYISSASEANKFLKSNFSANGYKKLLNPYSYIDPRDADAVMFAIEHLLETDMTLFYHDLNVAIFSVIIGKTIGIDNYKTLFIGGLLHDIGKTLISHHILYKPDKLTYEEFEAIKKHPQLGAHYLFKNGMSDPAILDMVKLHHVYFDRTGYPKIPKKLKVSCATQIITICDAFDAMCSKRVYSEGKTLEEARKELIKEKGKQFNPDLVDVFLEKMTEFYPVTQVKRVFKKEDSK